MTTKVCKHCKREYQARSNGQIYCSEQCRLKAKQLRLKARSEANVVYQPNTHKLCNRKDCLYYNKYDANRCDFFYLTGELRGCKNGDSCTRYKKATESERKKYRDKILRGMCTSETEV